MTAYYNENDPKASAWLRELIKEGRIAQGIVDDRSIEDITPSDLEGFAQCHFFAGIGGWSYALRLAGWPDGRPVWTGSCPCQPFSTAGKGGGFADERHLWPAWFHLIRECRPPVIYGEQVASSAGLTWFDLVSTDLEGNDYAIGAASLPAASAGYPHRRYRLFWVAEAADHSRSGREGQWPVAREPRPEFTGLVQRAFEGSTPSGPYELRDDGVPGSMGLLRGFGNAIVPQVAAAFIRAYLG
jgi:DNA (cytosine-5)-methyltransferase 1